jgi:hypothetical protein
MTPTSINNKNERMEAREQYFKELKRINDLAINLNETEKLKITATAKYIKYLNQFKD